MRHLHHRFQGVYVIRPAHNPIRPLDLTGAYDEKSDRVQTLDELMERGFEDAYRQFIEPVVGASGDRMTQVTRDADRTRHRTQILATEDTEDTESILGNARTGSVVKEFLCVLCVLCG